MVYYKNNNIHGPSCTIMRHEWSGLQYCNKNVLKLFSRKIRYQIMPDYTYSNSEYTVFFTLILYWKSLFVMTIIFSSIVFVFTCWFEPDVFFLPERGLVPIAVLC